MLCKKTGMFFVAKKGVTLTVKELTNILCRLRILKIPGICSHKEPGYGG